MPHKYLLKEFEDLARTAASPESLMQHVAQRIHLHVPRYNWVGFYLIDKNDPTALILGPHAGSFVPNQKVLLNQGLCGSAASLRRTIVADNVAEDPRYLQASDLVKSQISVPVEAAGRLFGVFNVESYFLSAFRAAVERDFIEACTRLVGRCSERMMAASFATV
jgi:GAF domain-containing protein